MIREGSRLLVAIVPASASMRPDRAIRHEAAVPHEFRQEKYRGQPLLQRKSVPLTQLRCRMTASRRAKATIAFCIPRRAATFIAHAFSHDHLVVRVSIT